ncbi:MAG: hypothetical protein FJW92_08670, partial [Actinobacteria bacterium]|nr:hypothetical protein [Actinomycetota bacterium]
IDLQALRHNATRLARAAGGAELMAVVKANGYGHGAVDCAFAALDGGAGSLAVASVEEAEELRLGGLTARILIMSPLAEAGFDRALAAGCEVVVGDAAGAVGITAAATTDRPARVHVEVDTGMGRLGAVPDDAMALAEAAASSGAEVVGLMTHFATADDREGPQAGFMRRWCAFASSSRHSAIAFRASRCTPPTAPPPCATPMPHSTWCAAELPSMAARPSAVTPPTTS